MKTITMMLFGLGLSLTVLAGGPRVVGSPKVSGGVSSKVVVRSQPYFSYGPGYGYRSFYPPFYSYYNPFYSPFAYGRPSQPSQLDLQIEQINNDYRHDIADARHDKSLSGDERKQKIRDLRHERANSITDAKKDYYHSEDRSEDNTRRDDDTISVN